MVVPGPRLVVLLLAIAGVAIPLHGQGRPEATEQILPDAPSASFAGETPAQVEAESTSVTVYANETKAEHREWVHSVAARELKSEEEQRILTVVPNFNTVISGEAMPLSKGQKLDLAVHNALDPFNIVGSVVLAGAAELGDSHSGYGWGPGGFGKRVGAQFADVTNGTMLAGAVYPILLHQDPRYFRRGTGSIKSRVVHALSAPFLCRGDNGLPQVNASNILGNFTAGAISNAYYPANERGVGLALVNSSVVMLEGALGSVGLEFAPDVEAWWNNRRIRHSDVAAKDPDPQAPNALNTTAAKLAPTIGPKNGTQAYAQSE